MSYPAENISELQLVLKIVQDITQLVLIQFFCTKISTIIFW